MRSFFISLPFGLGSAFVEWREQYLGFGRVSHSRTDHEVFVGRLQVTYSTAAVRTLPRPPEGRR